MVIILATAETKAAIMRTIVEQAGPQTSAGAICFSLPVTQVAGLRQAAEEDKEPDEEA